MHAAAIMRSLLRSKARPFARLCKLLRQTATALLLLLLLAPASFAAQTRDTFDHLTTGFELLGQHRDLPCESCHANAVFKGTPRECSACHGIGTAIRATAKTATHILSTDRCDSCHTPIAWKPAVNFDHAEAQGSCSTCHNNIQAQGKGPQHIDTDLECDACHSTISWAGAVFNHSGIVSGCASCHNGVQATGPPATHIPVNGTPCEGCHSTTNFTTFAGTLMNHQAVTALTCASCHETAAFLGMSPSTATAPGDSRPPAALDRNHPSSGDCGQCHDTSSFTSAAATRPANHIPTNAPCTQCHTTPGNNATFSVTGVHQGVTECLSCHAPAVAGTFANVSIVTTPSSHIPIGSLDCNGAGCHTAANVNPGGFNIGSASIGNPTLTSLGHATVAAAVPACGTCHESAPYMGMLASSSGVAGDSRPSATLDKLHPATGDCGTCHTTSPTFASDVTSASKPAGHIPTSAPCSQCHTTSGNYALYSVTGVHQGVTGCLSCHAPGVAAGFLNVTITTTPGNHIPIGNLDCNGSGCHGTSNVSAGGFMLGAANVASPTLSVPGHTTVATVVPACQTCHQSAPYLGMIASSATLAGDSRPPAALDSQHPTSGDCGGCHLTLPTFASDVVAGTKPANHIPTSAACTQCHTTPGNFAVYSVTGTHIGATACLTCHAPAVAATFANITITTTPGNHFPIGAIDCNGSGCHSATNVNPGGFSLGAANIGSPTLSIAGHTTVATAVAGCQACHETAPYLGMLASGASSAGDSRPTALDKSHPTTGDCGGCHTTAPTFATNETGGSTKPANHIPTSAPCAQCHTTPGNYAAYSVTGTHQGVTSCLSCHAASVAASFANITITTTSANHIPVGNLDCNGSGCHTTVNVNAGGFNLGSANISTPTLNTAGHTTVAAAVASCQTCHESAPYQGMIPSTASAAGDSRPTAFDKSHPGSGDCGGCHTTTPTFAANVTSAVKPSNHIPTNAPCTQCHTTAGNYAAYVMGATGHAGITSGCAQCHADGLAFANMAPPTLIEPPTGATGHIPVGTLACELCHSVTNFTTFSGTVMKHSVVRANACDSCHEYGMRWKTNTGVQLWTRPEPSHHAGQDCGGSGCHNSRDKRAIRPVIRPVVPPGQATSPATVAAPTAHGSARPTVLSNAALAAAASPAAATAALLAAAKPSTHIASTNNCLMCHTTLAWLPVKTVDHTQVVGACESCHNGHTALGKPSRHIATSGACASCHTTNAWTPARFDHRATAPHSCASCHNAVQAIGMPRNHIPTSQPCDSCHGTLAWLPAKLDHSSIRSGCPSCHNNAVAVGKNSDHMTTQRDCATCHSYPDWSALAFVHSAAAWPGNHRAPLVCTACHTTNSDAVPYQFAAAAGTCAGCHAKDFKPTAHPKTAKGEMYTAAELANCTGACHIYNDPTRSILIKSLPGPYHRVTDAAFKR